MRTNRIAIQKLVKIYEVKTPNRFLLNNYTQKKRYCPIDKLEMQLLNIERTIINYCSTCFGIWFDSGELKQLLGKELDIKGLSKKLLFEEHHDKNKNIDRLEKFCPACTGRLVKRQNRQKSRIQ